MSKSEQDVKIEEFKTAMSERNYDEAIQIADTLDIKHIRDNNLLCLIADAYELSKDYELAKQVLLFAYENTKAGRHLAYRLCLVCLKNGEYDEAKEYYEDFVEMAPKDTGRYVLQYKMAEAANEPKDKLIGILEEYVNIDMEEKWAYELAKLYKDMGYTDKCIELCDEIGLWFSEGRYIKKAMELKKSITPLNITQQQLLDKEEEPEVKEEESKPHVSKSPIESIMERQSENNYQPSFDITEIKLVDDNEVQKEPEDVLTAQPVEEGPKQMSFFKDDTPSNNVYDEPEKKPLNTLFGTGAGAFGKSATDTVDSEPKIISPKVESNDSPFAEDDNKLNSPLFDLSGSLDEPADNDVAEVSEEPLPDVKDVEEMLKQLRDRGILDSDTVDKAVNIIDNDTNIEEELPEEVEDYEPEDSTSEPEESVSESEQPAPELVSESEELEETEVQTESEELSETLPEDEEEEIGFDSLEEDSDVHTKYDPEDSKYRTMQMGSRWENEDKAVIENEPVETGSVDDFEAYEEPGLKEQYTEEINTEQVQDEIVDAEKKAEEIKPLDEEVEIKPTEQDDLAKTTEFNLNDETPVDPSLQPTAIVPDGDELEKESKKPIQTGKVLDEAVPPKSEIEKDVPVFDLSGEYTSSEDLDSPENQDAPKLKESKDSSAKIDMITKGVEIAMATEAVKDVVEEKAEEKTEDENEEKTTLADKDTGIISEKPSEPRKISSTENEEPENKRLEITDEDMKAFSNYLNVEGLENSIKIVLNSLIDTFVSEGKTNRNVLIMGDEQTGKTTMAIEIIKLVNKKCHRNHRRLAKIDALVLNSKGIAKAMKKLSGCDLIIENAHMLYGETINDLVIAAKNTSEDMIIILEAETEPMEELMDTVDVINDEFKHKIIIKQYNLKEWVEFGSEYAKEKGYKLDEVAELALFKTIDETFGVHKGISSDNVKEIIDKAIGRSERFGKKLSGIFGSQKDDDGLRLLDESDFNINLK